MAKKKQLMWISTAGGPHLVVPAKHAPHWEGVAEPRRGRKVEATFRYDPRGPATDYDRACDVAGWQGVLRVGRGRGLVLTGDLAMAAPYEWDGRTFVLRWLYAPSEKALLARFRAVWPELPTAAEDVVTHPGGALVLCDAGDTPRSWLGEHTTFTLPAGRYNVTAHFYRAEDISLVVHAWQHVGRANR